MYQEAGILQPESVDPDTGYRGYSIGQSVKLDMIAQLQNAGFTLSDIAEAEAAKDVDLLKEHAERRSREAEEEIARLRAEKRACDEIVRGCESYLGRSLCGTVLVERVPDRKIILLDAPTWDDLGGEGEGEDGDAGEGGYTDNERWEWYQQYTKRRLAEGGFPRALFRRVGCYVPVEEARPDVNLQFARPFVFVDESFGADVLARAETLPGGMCLTAYYDDCHSDGGADLDRSRLARLFAFADEHGLEPCGPLTMENIFRYMRLFNQDAHAYFRYCLPVRGV